MKVVIALLLGVVAKHLHWIHSLGTGIERIISIPEVVEMTLPSRTIRHAKFIHE